MGLHARLGLLGVPLQLGDFPALGVFRQLGDVSFSGRVGPGLLQHAGLPFLDLVLPFPAEGFFVAWKPHGPGFRSGFQIAGTRSFGLT